jgi:hypothetical protein
MDPGSALALRQLLRAVDHLHRVNWNLIPDKQLQAVFGVFLRAAEAISDELDRRQGLQDPL